MSAPPRRHPPPSVGSPKKRSRPAPQAMDQLGKRKKPKDMPRRPLSAYNMYFQEERKKTIAKYKRGEVQDDFCLPPGKDPSEALFQAVSRTVANRWKAMTESQRKPFYDRAQAEMDIYRQKMDEYNQKMIDSSTLAQRLAETQREQLAESKLLTEQLERERRAKETGGGDPKPAAAPPPPPSALSSSTSPSAVSSMRPLLDDVPDANRAMKLTSRLRQQQDPAASSLLTSTTFPAFGQQEQGLLSRQAALLQLLQESRSQLPTTASRLPQQDLSNFVAVGGGTTTSSPYNSSNSNNIMIPSTMAASQFPNQPQFPGSGSHTIMQQQGNDHAALLQQIQQLLAQQQQQQTQRTSLETLLQELARGDTQQRAAVASFPSALPHANLQHGSSTTNINYTLLRMLQIERLLALPSSVMQPPPPPRQQFSNNSDWGQLLQERPELIQLLQAAQQQQQQQQQATSSASKQEQAKWAEDLFRLLSRRNP
eukprot:scaffold3632_cov162-Amphora_coffeaeformis.AAC.17